jgi:hypothetical protein
LRPDDVYQPTTAEIRNGQARTTAVDESTEIKSCTFVNTYHETLRFYEETPRSLDELCSTLNSLAELVVSPRFIQFIDKIETLDSTGKLSPLMTAIEQDRETFEQTYGTIIMQIANAISLGIDREIMHDLVLRVLDEFERYLHR